MTAAETGGSTRPRKLRLWPGEIALAVQLLVWFGVPWVAPEATAYAMLGALACGLAIFVWWMFFSRAPWLERIGAIVLMAAGVAAATRIVDRSIANGMMGFMLPIYSIPVMSLALVQWAVWTRRLGWSARWAALAATILAACGGWALLRTNGITGAGHAQLAWRWTKTPEQLLLARAASLPPASPVAPAPAPSVEPPKEAPAPVAAPAARAPVPIPITPDWPGFRGLHRDGVIHGVRIRTDWGQSPPVERWRRKVGPGWSSFAVGGGLIYTQEQRGDFEVVACYKEATGEPVWAHKDHTRFWESNGGAGPRATPTLSGGRVYTFGATGIVNALDAATGAVVWTRNAAVENGIKVPGWGFSSSPLIADGVVIVAVSGRLAAYDAATGAKRWAAATGSGSYSSPELFHLGGVEQLLLVNGAGVTAVASGDGKALWKYAFPGPAILQPALAPDGDILITTGGMSGGDGTRRLTVAKGPGGWAVNERWMSRGLKPYFNDLVVHKGHAFGFDGNILSCIDLTDGHRAWKGGRYGNGQLVLLADQDLLLVLSEEGEVALVAAVPDQFTEVAKFRAMEGKTWNHPVVVGDTLLVRNGEEMVAYRLALAGG